MTLSDVHKSLHDLKTLLGYDDRFDAEDIEIRYKNLTEVFR